MVRKLFLFLFIFFAGARDKSLQRSDDELSSSDVQTLPNDSIHIFSSPV